MSGESDPPAAAEPQQTMRENMINEAVKFLTNPNVAQHPDAEKSSFLRKKGLSASEIQEAFIRTKAILPTVQTSVSTSPVIQAVPQAGPLISYSAGSPPMWIRIRDFCNFVLILTGASYGVYYLYKKYLAPLITGKKEKTVEESMIELQSSIVAVLKEVQTTLSSLEQTLSVQNVRIQNIGSKEEKDFVTSKQLGELKSEITSLKGLLINRRTFPSTPSMSPSIPSWQRTKTEKTVEEAAVSDTSVPTQEEVITVEKKHLEIESKIEEETAGQVNGESIASEGDTSFSLLGENSPNGESLSLIECIGESSDEMSQ